ncbi:putative pentatricopeptide repeat protein [Erysiphe necator]|uniref:Putative pentatricopeptide repeat protein n=1 Tax=Uncinula necator TaxID=52586 RepID=A0A0B1NYI7_UNCNE|nr:putative pentatricopeptide repeat protein [Erysiphe necator]
MSPRLMLSHQKFSVLRNGGTICKSCLRKLQVSRQRQSIIYRSFSHHVDSRSRNPNGPRVDREIHFYDQNPEGDRVERFVDKEYEDRVEEELLDSDLKQTIEENMPTLKKMYKSSIPNEYQLIDGLKNLEEAGKQFKAFAEKIKLPADLDKLSSEQHGKLREHILENDFFADTYGQDLQKPFKPENKNEIIESGDQESPYEIDPEHIDFSLVQKYLPSDSKDSSSQGNNSNSKSIENIEDKRTARHFPVTSFPKLYQDHISLLQDCLDACFEHEYSQKIGGKSVKVTKEMLRAHLARAYMFARKGLLAAPESIPIKMWEELWQVLEAQTKENLNRLTYMRRLGEDMHELGIPMSNMQLLVYVEALFLDGARRSAVNKWQTFKPQKDDPIWHEYWEIGLRMFAQLGQLDKAFEIAEIYFKDLPEPSHFHALMPLIKACLISKKDRSIQRAWALYLRLKVNLGRKIVMNDYDVLISWFMDAKEPELALAIFRDMMLTGDQLGNRYNSIAVQKISGIIADFKGVKIEQSELEWENTRALSILPAKFNNKLFFGSWIKKLIGDDELNSAKKVIDLMQDHGITPSPMYMNGLIGAWFRRGNEHEFAMADELAWRMINRRLEHMDIRDFRHSLQSPLRPVLNGRSIGDRSALVFPMATVETFSLLVQQYRQRQKKESLSALFDAFVRSRIPPNTKYLNQVILTDTRNHKTSLAFETYRCLTARGVKPDYETFILLWNLMKRCVDPSVGRKIDWQSKNIGTCRLLFAEMIKRKADLCAKHVFPRELYDLIILSFSLKQDNVGTSVALRALQQEFSMFPDENCIRSIVFQLARFGLRNKFGMKPRRLDLSLPMTKDRIGSVMQLFQKMRNQRSTFLLQKGIDPESLSIEDRKEESIIITSEVLRQITIARLFGEKRVNVTCFDVAEQAAKQMGVPHCVVWE